VHVTSEYDSVNDTLGLVNALPNFYQAQLLQNITIMSKDVK